MSALFVLSLCSTRLLSRWVNVLISRSLTFLVLLSLVCVVVLMFILLLLIDRYSCLLVRWLSVMASCFPCLLGKVHPRVPATSLPISRFSGVVRVAVSTMGVTWYLTLIRFGCLTELVIDAIICDRQGVVLICLIVLARSRVWQSAAMVVSSVRRWLTEVSVGLLGLSCRVLTWMTELTTVSAPTMWRPILMSSCLVCISVLVCLILVPRRVATL